MGGWFLSTSIGNKLSGVLASMWDQYDDKANFFWVNFGLLMFATRTYFADAGKLLNKKPGRTFLWGLAYFVGVPVTIIVLMVTIIGIPFGLSLLALFLITVFFAKILTAMVLERVLEIRMKRKWKMWPAFFITLGIYVVLKIISFIPILGWLACAVLCMMAFGALMITKYDRYLKIR